MEQSTSKVSEDISWCESAVAQEERHSDFDYIESTSGSEFGSSDGEEDAEKLELCLVLHPCQNRSFSQLRDSLFVARQRPC